MLIAIVGGGLQGVEVAYLSKKAGWEVMVMDKKSDPPAKGLAHDFVQVDICEIDQASEYLEKADLVLPALENDGALEALDLWQKTSNTPMCFDMDAYALSSSKQRSNNLFTRMNIPKPLDWPECGFPVVIKPSTGSGSLGVRIISSKDEWIKDEWKRDEWINDECIGDEWAKDRVKDQLVQGQLSKDQFLKKQFLKDQSVKELYVVEEYINGPSYSLEIIGSPGRYKTLQVTQLYMDVDYDCKRVIVPAEIEAKLVKNFEQSAKIIAREMKLTGIMDFEVILHKGEMKMLEIDARFPSQTPMAVFASTGMNMVEILADQFLKRKMNYDPEPILDQALDPTLNQAQVQAPEHAIIEHIFVSPRGIEIRGENIMKFCGPLHMETGFFGADEAVTSFVPGESTWVATMIIKGKTSKKAWYKRKQILDDLGIQLNLPLLPDIDPYGST